MLRDAGGLRLDDLAVAANTLIAAARAGRIAAILAYACSILGVGAPRPVFRPDGHGAPALREEIMLVLSADHRVLDGVRAARLLNAIVDLLERPLILLRG